MKLKTLLEFSTGNKPDKVPPLDWMLVMEFFTDKYGKDVDLSNKDKDDELEQDLMYYKWVCQLLRGTLSTVEMAFVDFEAEHENDLVMDAYKSGRKIKSGKAPSNVTDIAWGDLTHGEYSIWETDGSQVLIWENEPLPGILFRKK